MIDLNVIKAYQNAVKKRYLDTHKDISEKDFEGIVKNYYSQVYAKDFNKEPAKLFAKSSFEDFTHSLQDVVDVDFDKEVKS